MGAFNESYECGAQWYTNDLNLWQPEFNRIQGMQFWWLNIGLAIGVLPSQPHCCAWQGAVVPDGQATNAPLSESSMTGLEFYGVVVAIHYHQPNGYLQLTDSTLAPTALGWPSKTYPYNSSVALLMVGGSLNVVNCDLENQAGEGWRDPGARVVRMMGGTLSLKNIIYEAMSSFHISGGTFCRDKSVSQSVSLNTEHLLVQSIHSAPEISGMKLNISKCLHRSECTVRMHD